MDASGTWQQMYGWGIDLSDASRLLDSAGAAWETTNRCNLHTYIYIYICIYIYIYIYALPIFGFVWMGNLKTSERSGQEVENRTDYGPHGFIISAPEPLLWQLHKSQTLPWIEACKTRSCCSSRGWMHSADRAWFVSHCAAVSGSESRAMWVQDQSYVKVLQLDNPPISLSKVQHKPS